MKHDRRKFLVAPAAAYAALALVRFRAGAAEFTYKWAHDFTSSHPYGARSLQAADRIKQESNGRLEIRLFPSGQLGASVSILGQVRTGAIEFAGTAFTILESSVPMAGLPILSFVFSTHEEAWAALDGPFGKAVRAAIAKSNLHVFEGASDNSFRQICNSVKPLRTPDDLKGMKIRVTPTPTLVSTFKAFGASPTPVDGNQMYTAAQTHLVDGADVPLATIDSFKLYEVQKYVSLLNEGWNGYNTVANPDAWERLPKNLQAIVEKNFAAAVTAERSDMVKLDATLQTTLAARGMTFNQADASAFKAAVRSSGLYAQWRQQYGAEPWALLEKAVGKLA